MWVVKLGGSLARSPELVKWLGVFYKLRRKINFVIIPGGGIFADHIRNLQKQIGFDDDLAHRLATLSTDQYGLFLLSKFKKLQLADDINSVKRIFRGNGVPIFLSSKMIRNSRDVKRNWEFTSDSISAWFCQKIGAKNLILVKSANIKKLIKPGSDLGLSKLQKRNIIDRCFKAYAKKAKLDVYCLGPKEWKEISLEDFNRKRLGLGVNLND